MRGKNIIFIHQGLKSVLCNKYFIAIYKENSMQWNGYEFEIIILHGVYYYYHHESALQQTMTVLYIYMFFFSVFLEL